MISILSNQGTETNAPQFSHFVFLRGPSPSFLHAVIEGKPQLGHLCLFIRCLTSKLKRARKRVVFERLVRRLCIHIQLVLAISANVRLSIIPPGSLYPA